MKFTASYVEPQVSEQIASVVFADEENPDEPAYLALTRAIDIKDSAYHFEINDQSNSGYEGLASVKLSRKSLVVKLVPEKAEQLGEGFATITVYFEAGDETYPAIQATLEQVFEGSGIFKVV